MKHKPVFALCSPVIAAFALSACFTGEADKAESQRYFDQEVQKRIKSSQQNSIDGEGRVFYDKLSGIGTIYNVPVSTETVKKVAGNRLAVVADVRPVKYRYDPTTNTLCLLEKMNHCFNPDKNSQAFEVPDDLKNSIKLIEEAALRP